MMKYSWILIILFAVVIDSCKDMGSNVPPAPVRPTIVSIQPDSAFAGDTLTIVGTNFGATQGASAVSVSGVTVDTVYLWSDTEIRLKVPASAVSGSVSVTVGGTASNAATLKIRGTVATSVSFKNDVLPVFQNNCTSCHGVQNNLHLDSYPHLMAGNSDHGPVVTPGNGEGSVIIKKLRGTTFGARMPLTGPPYLSDATISNISLWITQGAQNN